MLCDNCIHSEICEYCVSYIKVSKTIKESFRNFSTLAGKVFPFNIPDVKCSHYIESETEIEKTPLNLSHRDDPGERGFNADIPSPPFSLGYIPIMHSSSASDTENHKPVCYRDSMSKMQT